MAQLESNDLQVRLAESKDAVTINQIYNQAIDDRFTADTIHQSPAQTLDWLSAHVPGRYPVWVLECRGEVIGWLSFSPYRNGRPAVNKTVEFSYYIERKWRGRGAGSVLLRFACGKAKELGFRHILAIILERNTAGISFAEKYGFDRWGYLPGVADFDGEICGHCYYGKHIL